MALLPDTSDEEGYADTYVIDTDAEDEREVQDPDPMTDVEPDDTPEEIATRESRQAEQPQVPELLYQRSWQSVVTQSSSQMNRKLKSCLQLPMLDRSRQRPWRQVLLSHHQHHRLQSIQLQGSRQDQ